MKKTLFFDIDGTLMNLDYFPESARRALTLARENGHEIVICTGRCLYQLKDSLLEYCSGAVSATGSYVFRGDRLLFQQYMSRDVLKKIDSVMTDAGAAFGGQADKGLVASESSLEKMRERFRRLGRPEALIDRIFGSFTLVRTLDECDLIRKVIYFDSPVLVDGIAEQLSGVCDVTPSSFAHDEVTSGELTILGVNKSFGMQKYIESFGGCRKDTVAFGDGANDLDMLEYAGIGVCMGNGSDILKAKADYITTDLDNDGIFNAMKHLGLI